MSRTLFNVTEETVARRDTLIKDLSDEINRLRAELEWLRSWHEDVSKTLNLPDGGRYRNDAMDRIHALRAELAEKDKRIAELEREYRVELDEDGQPSNIWCFTEEQISAAWEYATGPHHRRPQAIYALWKLGIVACPKCGGTKLITEYNPSRWSETVNRKCDCPNNGWVMEP